MTPQGDAPRLGAVDELQDRLNTVLHRQMGVWVPCLTACTHVIAGEWTALGAANVLARNTHDDATPGRSQ